MPPKGVHNWPQLQPALWAGAMSPEASQIVHWVCLGQCCSIQNQRWKILSLRDPNIHSHSILLGLSRSAFHPIQYLTAPIGHPWHFSGGLFKNKQTNFLLNWIQISVVWCSSKKLILEIYILCNPCQAPYLGIFKKSYLEILCIVNIRKVLEDHKIICHSISQGKGKGKSN